MILKLKTTNRQTVVDIELFIKQEGDFSFVELRSVIDVRGYSDVLLKLSNTLGGNTKQLIDDFEEISELRGWLWEVMDNEQSKVKVLIETKYNEILSLVKEKLQILGNKYSLYYDED